MKEGHTSTDRRHATIAPRGKFALPALSSGALLLRIADGSRLIEKQLQLVPGKNEFELVVDTKKVTLHDLPTAATGDGAGFVVAKWMRGATAIQLPIDVPAAGTATASLPMGKVLLQRAPTESDIGALLARGSYGLMTLRQITVE